MRLFVRKPRGGSDGQRYPFSLGEVGCDRNMQGGFRCAELWVVDQYLVYHFAAEKSSRYARAPPQTRSIVPGVHDPDHTL